LQLEKPGGAQARSAYGHLLCGAMKWFALVEVKIGQVLRQVPGCGSPLLEILKTQQDEAVDLDLKNI